MNIDKILDFFYEKTSNRVKERINLNKDGLKQGDIYPDDSALISQIVNNRRNKNNRYLITPAVIGNTDDEKEKLEYGLIPKLKFKNRKEVLWGTDEEIKAYLPDLFMLLWNEITEDMVDKELILCDYIPYAKYSTYWKILFDKNNKYPAILYGIYKDDVINRIDFAREKAIYYLYNKSKIDFEDIFLDFAKSTKSYSKINKVLEREFIYKRFIPMLKQYIPDETSLGLRAKNLINADLSEAPLLIYEYYNKGFNDEIKKLLINASSEYIVRLEEIQEKECAKMGFEKLS